MFKLINLTPFIVDNFVLNDHHKHENIYVTVKATFDLSHELSLSELQIPIFQSDEYIGVPGQSSLKAISEAHTGKSSSDILIYGEARSLLRQPTRSLSVSLKVGSLTKKAMIIGGRSDSYSDVPPTLFITMPLIWENTSKGSIIHSDSSGDSENPLGIDIKNKLGNRLPNIVSPCGNVSKPVGFSPVPPNWMWRRQYAGSYDQQWLDNDAPYLPRNFSTRFNNSAPPDQIYPGYLNGGEQVVLEGFCEDGTLEFVVPKIDLIAKVDFVTESKRLSFDLETLAIYLNDRLFSLTFRCKVPVPRELSQLKSITVSVPRQ